MLISEAYFNYFYYLIGKTGSGKSTLFRSIYAEIGIQSGTASVAGYSLNSIKRSEVPFLRRKLGFVFQDFQLLTDRNVEKNLSFVLEATGHQNKDENRLKIEEVLARVGMSSAISKRIHRLSGGEQQRISIARAILNNPDIRQLKSKVDNYKQHIEQNSLILKKEKNQKNLLFCHAPDLDLIIQQWLANCHHGKNTDSNS